MAKDYEMTFWSLNEFADKCQSWGYADTGHGVPRSFNAYTSFDDGLEMARMGWTEELDKAIDVAESAVELCEKEHDMVTFMPVHDVTGCDVDVARYLSGEPECMIEYPVTLTSKVGKVITLCASMTYSAAIDQEVIKRRGQAITALAIALTRLGHSAEFWADFSVKKGSNTNRVRVLIKGANDVIDPARILFAYSHPGMLRHLGISAWAGVSNGVITGQNGYPVPPRQDLPEGTLYLPEVCSRTNIPEAAEQLVRYLRELELIQD
jgi:hypothetical protein